MLTVPLERTGPDKPGLQPSDVFLASRDPGWWPGLVWPRTFGAGFRCNQSSAPIVSAGPSFENIGKPL